MRICFVGYRDFGDNERFALKEFTEDLDKMRDFIAGVPAEGGDDIPEDVVGGLKLLLMQDWTAEASKKVFLIGDAPTHGQKYHNIKDNYPAGSPDGLKLEDLMKEYREKDIDFNVIKLNPSVEGMVKVMKEYHDELESKDMYDQMPSQELPSYDYSSGFGGGGGGAMMSAATGITMEKMFSLKGAAMDSAIYKDECEDLEAALDRGASTVEISKARKKKVAFIKAEVERRDRETTESYMKYAVGSVAATVQKNCARQGIKGGMRKK